MVHPSQQKPAYACRNAPPVVTIARNGRRWSFNVKPWLAGLLVGLLAMFSAANLGAAGYLLYRDDLLGGSIARRSEMQHAYEARIAALRSELDRIASRHAVQEVGIEEQIASLLERQAILESRQSTLDQLIETARTSGIKVAQSLVRVPRARPEANAGADASAASGAPLAYSPTPAAGDAAIKEALIRHSEPPRDLEPLVMGVTNSLDATDAEQQQAIDALDAAAAAAANDLSSALAPLGIELGHDRAADPQGGPFIAATALHFVERAAMLDRSLEELAAARRKAALMPVGAPVHANRVSSGYGYRRDPFLGERALHAGVDFDAPYGAEVRATAAGLVVSAGWSGGYGYMVEIRHAAGLTTRYGHLSAILVEKGATVSAGTPLGRVGNTGRSTGPHLHYETRRDGEPVNPAVYLAAGRAL
jgi:murein DD-endopeptidase MepM/ murein hydrolase activator NlpD